MGRLVCSFVLLATAGWAAAPPQFPYDQDKVPRPDFNGNGSWLVQDVAGLAQVTHLTKRQRRKLTGTTLQLDGAKASFWNKKLMQWPYLATPVINEESYNTQSKEFQLDFETDPAQLNLPTVITVINFELGHLVSAGPHRMLLLYEGIWYNVKKQG